MKEKKIVVLIFNTSSDPIHRRYFGQQKFIKIKTGDIMCYGRS